VIVAGRLGQSGQIGRLADGQLVQSLVEIGERRGDDPVGSLAQIDLVQIELEDAVLGIGLLPR
jgi:hypothetical protein